MKRKFIINPMSGGQIKKDHFTKIQKLFNDTKCEFDHVYSKSSSDLRVLTRQALHEGYEQIIAVGGDGTIHQVVNGFFENGEMINPNASLGVSKNGTGSDFFKTISDGAVGKEWPEIILDNNIHSADVGKFRFLDSDDEYFINIGSVGISSDIVLAKEKLPKWVPNQLKYIFPTIKAAKSYDPPQVEISFDDEKLTRSILGLFICNGMFAGGGMKFGPGAKLNSGVFDLTLINQLAYSRALYLLPKLFKGAFSGIKEIEQFQSKKVTFRSESKIGVELDGEYVGSGNFEVEVIPNALNLCFPSGHTL